MHVRNTCKMKQTESQLAKELAREDGDCILATLEKELVLLEYDVCILSCV